MGVTGDDTFEPLLPCSEPACFGAEKDQECWPRSSRSNYMDELPRPPPSPAPVAVASPHYLAAAILATALLLLTVGVAAYATRKLRMRNQQLQCSRERSEFDLRLLSHATAHAMGGASRSTPVQVQPASSRRVDGTRAGAGHGLSTANMDMDPNTISEAHDARTQAPRLGEVHAGEHAGSERACSERAESERTDSTPMGCVRVPRPGSSIGSSSHTSATDAGAGGVLAEAICDDHSLPRGRTCMPSL